MNLFEKHNTMAKLKNLHNTVVVPFVEILPEKSKFKLHTKNVDQMRPRNGGLIRYHRYKKLAAQDRPNGRLSSYFNFFSF